MGAALSSTTYLSAVRHEVDTSAVCAAFVGASPSCSRARLLLAARGSTCLHHKHCVRCIGAGKRSVWAAELELHCLHALLVDAHGGLEHTLHVVCAPFG